MSAAAFLLTLACAAPAGPQALAQDFDLLPGQAFPPAGWSTADNGTAPRVWGEASAALPASSVYMTLTAAAAAHDYSAAGVPCDSWLVSPPADLRGYATPRLVFESDVFWVQYMAHYPGALGDGRSTVEVSVDGGASWTQAWSESALLDGLYAVEVDLTPVSGLPSVRVAFRYRGSDAHAWAVDTVRIDNAGAPVGPGIAVLGDCPGAAQLRATGMTPGGLVAVYAAGGPGATTITGSTCAGTVLPAVFPTRLPVGMPAANADGLLVLQGQLPAAACGLWWLGVVDLASCAAPPLVPL